MFLSSRSAVPQEGCMHTCSLAHLLSAHGVFRCTRSLAPRRVTGQVTCGVSARWQALYRVFSGYCRLDLHNKARNTFSFYHFTDEETDRESINNSSEAAQPGGGRAGLMTPIPTHSTLCRPPAAAGGAACLPVKWEWGLPPIKCESSHTAPGQCLADGRHVFAHTLIHPHWAAHACTHTGSPC